MKLEGDFDLYGSDVEDSDIEEDSEQEVPVSCVAYAPDGLTLASAHGHEFVIWQMSTGAILAPEKYSHKGGFNKFLSRMAET